MYDVQFEEKVSDAIERGNLEEVKELLGNDIEKLNMDIPRGNWLHIAVTYEQMEIIKYLLDSGINRNLMTEEGNCIVIAAGIGNVDMIEYLLQNGIELTSTLNQLNPIFTAVQSDSIGVFQYLLELEAKVLTETEYAELMKLLIREAEIYGSKSILSFLAVNVDKKESTKKILKEQKDRIIQLFKNSAKICLKSLQDYYEDEKIYILSLDCDDNLSKIFLHVNTVENLQECLDEADDDMKDEIFYYKYCEDEWYIFDESVEYFAGVGKYIADEGINNSDKNFWYELVVESVIELRKEKFFDSIGLGEVLITIYEHDIYSKKEFIKLFKKMNKGKQVDEFIDNMEDFY